MLKLSVHCKEIKTDHTNHQQDSKSVRLKVYFTAPLPSFDFLTCQKTAVQAGRDTDNAGAVL